ncbi:deoxyribonuclease gamma-like [Limulus polyphemus]|uniref:Deoxyribonuclease gamma-like n=1 Tax=Limulus polyphemus TaxID=6850 RepID=A0ABM1BXG7_LIMPO|nr:deoxyribonuclease gamma-like [Limulus polyphemus]
MALSERLGRGTAKEQYAYIYRDDKLSVLDEQAFPDVEDLFMRPPYIVHFSSPTTRDLSSFVAICSHTQPSGAANETHALATVYDYAQNHYKNPNAIIMGDFNAGCSNVRVGDWNWIALWTREEFTWLIGHHIDTTTYVSSCPYDRFVIAGSKMESAVIPGSPKAFDFQEEYSLTDDQTL